MAAVKKLENTPNQAPLLDAHAKSFIEVQFPISKLSKESYKERKAGSGQTLTGLGKWWGRKPLILVRATIIGCLMPASSNPTKDREIFLKILTMDNEGLWRRKKKGLEPALIFEKLTQAERNRYFPANASAKKPKYMAELSTEKKKEAEHLAWERLSYDEKLEYCLRPEEIDGPSQEAWTEINSHLGTKATTISELVQELGKRRFGHIPRVGDAFCGGGSVPFEAARIGCDAYGSDLNPVAALLTWGALNIVGADKKTAAKIKNAQEELFAAVDKQITEWGIEHNEKGWRADVYLYCNEVTCPECKWNVPLAPTWVISEKSKVIAILNPVKSRKAFDIAIESDVSDAAMKAAKSGTVGKSGLCCPSCRTETPIKTLRGDRTLTETDAKGKEVKVTKYGLRLWENDDIEPRDTDVFRERLYCIRWQTDEGSRVYAAPNKADLNREAKVRKLLGERFKEWQKKGYIPSMRIESGDKTDELVRTRGWTHWHHLFNARQLLMFGLVNSKIFHHRDQVEQASISLWLLKATDWNSKLVSWNHNNAQCFHAFANQALNPLYNYGHQSFVRMSNYMVPVGTSIVSGLSKVHQMDARLLTNQCDLWLTDPPYADAVNYHEISEYFINWLPESLLKTLNGQKDSLRALAVKGSEADFRSGMVECYSSISSKMPIDGLQVVMFTHQSAEVWADLSNILWAAGLQVVSAWCIATEADSALREGNYVKGTVFLLLRKRTTKNTAFLDELLPNVEDEVKRQVNHLIEIDDTSDPNFGDSDIQLAAYAAALRVLTSYASIEDIEIDAELRRKVTQSSPIYQVIENAVKIATEYLIPRGISATAWKKLKPSERLYLKGLDVESRGDCRESVYQELARGFGVSQYKDLLASSKSNRVRLRTPSEFARRDLDTPGFGQSLTRKVLFAIFEAKRSDGIIHGKSYLREELPDYWGQRKTISEILDYISSIAARLHHWKEDGDLARLLK